MAAVCVYSPTIGALKFALKKLFPTVKSSHLTEALAAALGFRTNAALQKAFSPNLPTLAAVLSDKWFVQRLVEFEYPAPEMFSFEAVALQPDTPIASLLVDIEPSSLWAMGQENSDLYYLCRTLQERGSKLPTFISLKSITPLLQQHGLMENGHTLINLSDMNRHMAVLESPLSLEDPRQKRTAQMLSIVELDFTTAIADRRPTLDFTTAIASRELTAKDQRNILRHDADKVVVKGIPPEALWTTLKELVRSGREVEFAEVFELDSVDGLQSPEAAALLGSWRIALLKIAELYRFAYDLIPDIRMGAVIASLNSLDQQFVTTIAALQRRGQDAAPKMANLLVDMGKMGWLFKKQVGGHQGASYSAKQGRVFRRPTDDVQHLVITPSGVAESMLDKIRPADRQALQEWAAQQQPGEGGSVDMMRWPGWAAAVANRIAAGMDGEEHAEGAVGL